jgi:1-deoxy-D-xylulose-5-phosphate synthase
VLDRAGVTGSDGASHNGMWDMSVLQVVPGIRIAAPRDADTMRVQLREAVAVDDAPTVLRFPKGDVPPPIPAVDRLGRGDVLLRDGGRDVLVVAIGAMAGVGVSVGHRLHDQGLGVTVVDPRWVIPVDEALLGEAAKHRLVVVIEDNGVVGGVGSRIRSELAEADQQVPVATFGIEQRFLEHGSRGELLERMGLTPQQISRSVIERMAKLDDQPAPAEPSSQVSDSHR